MGNNHTDGSGRQWPMGGSGGIGAPSSIIEQCSMLGIDSILVEIILPVSWARNIVDFTIKSQGNSSDFNRAPVNSACWRPDDTHGSKKLFYKIISMLYQCRLSNAVDPCRRTCCIVRAELK